MYLLLTKVSENEESEMEQDSEFTASVYEEEEESELDEESEYSDSDVEGGDEELSEEGLSWDELMNEAIKGNIVIKLDDKEAVQRQIKQPPVQKRKK